MAVYKVGLPDGRNFRVEAPEGTDPKQLAAYVATYYSGGARPASPMGKQAPRNANGKIDPDDLVHDEAFLKSAAVMYRHEEGRAFKGTAGELVDYGLQQMADFNYNLGSLTLDANRLRSAPEDYKRAFVTMMDTFDETEMSWKGAGRFGKAVATDPTTYVGLLTLGIGTAGKAAAQQASKQGIKQLLKQSLTRTAAPAAIEGAVVGAADEYIRQGANISMGTRTERSALGVAGMAGAGAAIGAGLGIGLDLSIEGGRAVRNFFRKADNPAAAQPVSENSLAHVDIPMGRTETSGGSIVPSSAVEGEVIPPNANQLPFTQEAEYTGVLPSGPRNLPAPEQAAIPNNAPEGLPAPEQAIPQAPEQAIINPSEVVPDGADMPPMKTVTPSIRDTVDDFSSTSTGNSSARIDGNMFSNESAAKIIGAIRKLAQNTGLRDFIGLKHQLREVTQPIVDMLADIPTGTVEETLEFLRRHGYTLEEEQLLKDAVMRANEAVLKMIAEAAQDPNIGESAIRSLTDLQGSLAKMDLNLSSATGRDLGNRRGAFLTGKQRLNATVEDYLSRLGLQDVSLATPEQFKEAVTMMVEDYDNAMKYLDSLQVIDNLKQTIDNATAQGDIGAAAQAAVDMRIAKQEAALAKRKMDGSHPFAERMNYVSEILTEAAISSVFTPGTTMRNSEWPLFKALVDPAMTAFSKGMSRASRKEMYASYYAMMRVQGMAVKAAWTSFRYEKTFLSQTGDKYLEFDPKIPDIKIPYVNAAIPFGRAWRMMHRFVLASDEYFSRVHFASIVEGRAAFEAAEAGYARNLSDDQVDALIAKSIEKARKESMEENHNVAEVLDMLTTQGYTRGMRGEALTEWVKSQYIKNRQVFTSARDGDAKSYLDDLMFKKPFTGDNAASKVAKLYEQGMNALPLSRLFQLFFRTPVRVFEAGFRLTPGLNLVTPKFLDDLMGKNSQRAQLRAQGEALMGFAFTGYAMAQYANGTITGAGPSDPKQRKEWLDKGYRPYSIKMSDGSWTSFRNLDPLSTPLKIMTNLMDRLGQAEMLDAQTPEEQAFWQEAAQTGTIALASVFQAVRDANLTEGISQLIEAFKVGMDADHSGMDGIVRLLADKTTMFIPNTFQKIQQMENGQQLDPVTYEQFIDAAVSPTKTTIPRAYDALGNIRKAPSTWGMLFGLDNVKDTGTAEDGDQQFVLEKLSQIGIMTGSNFKAPYKVKEYFGDTDLRKALTADGKQTLYDRWMQYYRESDPTPHLKEVLDMGGPIGTQDVNGPLTQSVKEIISVHRAAAFERLLKEEVGIQTTFDQISREKLYAAVGFRDVTFTPHQ